MYPILLSIDIILREIDTDYEGLIELIRTIPEDVFPNNLSGWGVTKKDIPILVDQSFTKGRMENNIVFLTKNDVEAILKHIF